MQYSAAFIKLYRFAKIYGLGKTIYKVVGRSRTLGKYFHPFVTKGERDTAVIGCGQFGYSTVGYSLCRRYGNRFVDCYDVQDLAKETFARFYQIPRPAISIGQLLDNPKVKYVYITSSHSSHSEYAVSALEREKIVYIEKPVSVDYAQLKALLGSMKKHDAAIYAGYNRPFSAAVLDLKDYLGVMGSPMTLNCFISGHQIPPDHWYREPSEGTRVCGNIGHWIDLAVHMLSWGTVPDSWTIMLAYSDDEVRDDDLSISMTSDRGDLVVITMTSRCEPFEGINETINMQCGDTICKIDDFRQMTVWQGAKLIKKRYCPKDVGHNEALLQPFNGSNKRDWNEVVKSTLMMLHITDMVRAGERFAVFSFSEAAKLHL